MGSCDVCPRNLFRLSDEAYRFFDSEHQNNDPYNDDPHNGDIDAVFNFVNC